MTHPNWATSFSPHSVTPNVCFQCNTETCAVNPYDPFKRVLHWEGLGNERWEVPAIEVGYRCLAEAVGQGGGPSAAQVQALEDEAATYERSLTAAEEALSAAEEKVRLLTSKVLKPLLDKGLSTAGIAGANAARKAQGPAA